MVLLDAIDDTAKALYEYHDFQALPGHDRRLVMKLITAAHALGLQWP